MAGPAYQWGHWRFEPSECRLLRDGVTVPLAAKTLDLLATLLRRAPRLLTKEEILSAVWADAVVEEGNIAFHVAALRKVLDEDDGPSAIENVRGRGYRFVHDIAVFQLPATADVMRAKLVVETIPAPPQTTPEPVLTQPMPTPPVSTPPAPTAAPPPPLARDRRPLIALLAVIVVTAALVGFFWSRFQSQSKSWVIAVEQFEIVNPPAGQEHFPDGLRTYIKTKLELAGVTTAEPDAATAVLSGQLHPSNGGFGVDIQLTRTSDRVRVWDWSFEMPRDYDLPKAGQDDARSRLQGAIATRAAEGVARYLSLSGTAPVTR